MKVIYIEQRDALFCIFENVGESGRSQIAQCVEPEQLKQCLLLAGASRKGVADVLRQLENSENAELRV